MTDRTTSHTNWKSSLQSAAATHRLIAYILVGGLSYVVDAGLLLLIVYVFGGPVWLGGTVGFWTSVLLNFLLNRMLFTQSGSAIGKNAARYGALLFANYLLTLAALELGASLGVSVLVSKTAITALATCWNYILYRTWVFT